MKLGRAGDGEGVAASGERKFPLFAYGTLQFGEVLALLLGRVPARRVGLGLDHEVRRMPGVNYPGLVEISGGQAPGCLIDDLSEEEWSIIDRYEDGFYELSTIEVRSEAAALERALTYRASVELVECALWTTEWFEPERLEEFLEVLRSSERS